MTTHDSLRLCIAGAPIQSPNRGVAALGRAVVDVVDASAAGTRLSIFDDGWGVRPAGNQGSSATRDYVGVRVSRRWHRPESWANIRAAQILGRSGNAAARRIAEADAVLDLSGGDSFTDLYGPLRFRTVIAPKRATLRAGRPLVLLPQTYGPFNTKRARRVAASIIRSARLCYARDGESYGRLLEIAGDSADVSRLREGVDVAFALTARRPTGTAADEIEAAGDSELMVGVNISGLLHGAAVRERFGLKGDYMATMVEVTKKLIAEGARVLFVSHVHGRGPARRPESDAEAISAIRSLLSSHERDRTLCASLDWDVAELKWAIAQCTWFTGSRMHATIGALSSGVPAFGYAYSDKTKGVFETCGMGEHVQDARVLSGGDAVDAMLASFAERDAARRVLAEQVPRVVERAWDQIADVLTDVQTWRDEQTIGARE